MELYAPWFFRLMLMYIWPVSTVVSVEEFINVFEQGYTYAAAMYLLY